ncbi:MAG: M56 family metallopeptidase [Candidatus Poribacteria bacterium]|nr:M56 family metallopeptidase [Candidatus Poribacteria bacterium]
MTKQILISLLNCSWQWVLLGGLTWLITGSVFRKSRRSNITVHLLWLLSLLSLPILFGLNQFVPALSIGSTVPEVTQAAPINISGLAAPVTDLPEISSVSSHTQTENQRLTSSKSFSNWETKTYLLLCLWAIGAFAMFIRFLFGLYRIRQLRRGAVVADDAYQSICQRLAQQLNIKRSVTVCFSDRIASPISFGWLSPYILVPRKLNLEQFELVAAHELAHVQRLDWLTNLFSHVVGVIFFFHPIYHLLNRELVRVRERICDDWVIQLTGARKNYAQCLLDLVRHEERTVPLALSLNQPSQLESRINSILKSKRQLDVQLTPRLRLIAVTLLLTCLPLLAMAQLVPLKTFQVSLFAQTPQNSPQKSEKGVDKTAKKQRMEKAKVGKMEGKQYKDESHIEVKDPTLFGQSEENKIFSGPQPGEKLPALTVTGIGGRIDGTTFDITTKADGKPLILFLQDTNGVGVKGLVNVSELLFKIDAFQKRHSKATGTETSNQGLQIGVVFLADNLDTLPEWARNMLKEEIPNAVLKGISPDGREGPGSYGLNRNVAQTVLIAKDGKVLHNFAFTQPMLYTDPHLLGAIAQTIGADPSTVEKWLNEEGAWLTGDENTNPMSATVEKWLNKEPAEGTRMERGGEQMEREGARDRERTLSREELVKRFDKDGDGKLNEEEVLAARRALANRENQNRYRRENVEVKNPAEFKKAEETAIFSGPQPGEKLPPLKVKGINGETKDKTFDVIAKADGQPLVLFLQDESGLGLRGLVGISRLLAQIREKSEQKMHISAVFLGDTPDTVENQVSKLVPHIPRGVLLGISQDGREGPGSYGLNRNVAQTVIIAKDGKVLHNFAFTQPMLRPDPYVLGAVGEAIGVKPATLEKWLNPKNPVIEIKNPTQSEKTGKMLLNGKVVQFDKLRPLLLNLPEEQKSMLVIQAGRDVLHEQIVKVMDTAKEAGIDQIEFAIGSVEGERMQREDTSEEARAFGRRLREMVEKGEITGEEARERYENAFPRSREPRRSAED